MGPFLDKNNFILHLHFELLQSSGTNPKILFVFWWRVDAFDINTSFGTYMCSLVSFHRNLPLGFIENIQSKVYRSVYIHVEYAVCTVFTTVDWHWESRDVSWDTSTGAAAEIPSNPLNNSQCWKLYWVHVRKTHSVQQYISLRRFCSLSVCL